MWELNLDPLGEQLVLYLTAPSHYLSLSSFMWTPEIKAPGLLIELLYLLSHLTSLE